ncbi:LPS export ABC transporter periplasmic protein LptC [Undibacterium sp. SXout20W]|uniref:LPS export ABC transporter periplasmic protein LptC n=1 Tax=Undibacterium sp. SXout20W TaxID=3413051 RepID=UPI003BF3D66C
MKAQITIDRARIWIAVAILGFIALGSFWIENAFRQRGVEDARKSMIRLEPDYYVEKFNFIRLSNSSKANYHLTGEKLIHLPRTDQYEITNPRINSFADMRPPVTIIAGRAIVDQKSDTVHPKREHDVVRLYDNVLVERPDGENSHAMRLETDYLTLTPDDDLITSDHQVTLFTEGIEAHAVGMVANNSTQHLELLSKVRARLKKRGS